jgi:RNA recognition motif-containing protein
MTSLFVQGFHQQLSEDELFAFFERFPGFETLRMKTSRTGQKLAFVDFSSMRDAADVIDNLDGRYNRELDGHLTCNEAKNNPGEGRKGEEDRRPSAHHHHQHPSSSSSSSSFGGNERTSPLGSRGNLPARRVEIPEEMPEGANKSLFVIGFPEDASVRELAHIFRPFVGFENVRIIRKREGRSFAVVSFQDAFQATVALLATDGYVFDLTPRSGSLKVEYSRVVGRDEDQV